MPDAKSQAERNPSDASVIARHPATAYFELTFTISWLGALAMAPPHLLRHD